MNDALLQRTGLTTKYMSGNMRMLLVKRIKPTNLILYIVQGRENKAKKRIRLLWLFFFFYSSPNSFPFQQRCCAGTMGHNNNNKKTRPHILYNCAQQQKIATCEDKGEECEKRENPENA